MFSIGGRAQRVRFLLASHGQSFDQIQQILGPVTASITTLIQDPIQSDPNRPQGKFIRATVPPATAGLGPFAEGNDGFAGLAVNPGLVLCLSNTLGIVKSVGDRNADLFAANAIDEVNLFARAVPRATGEPTLRVGIGPAAGGQPNAALDVLVEYRPLDLACALPSEQDFASQLANPERL